MFILDQLKVRMQEMEISPNKLLGQNFLVSQHVISKIIDAAIATKKELFIEVGPGPGALTDRLLEHGVNIRLVEMDRKIGAYWESRGLDLVIGDALKQDWSQLTGLESTCFVSNLPYQISSSIVIDRSVEPCGVEVMILMFQKEVAQRLVASPSTKDYSLLSVMAQSFWKISKVVDAGPKDFFPPPKIASRVMQFQERDCDCDRKLLLRLVKASFAQRRKKLVKNLAALENYKLDEAKEFLKKQKLSESVRAEELSIEQFQGLVGFFI